MSRNDFAPNDNVDDVASDETRSNRGSSGPVGDNFVDGIVDVSTGRRVPNQA